MWFRSRNSVDVMSKMQQKCPIKNLISDQYSPQSSYNLQNFQLGKFSFFAGILLMYNSVILNIKIFPSSTQVTLQEFKDVIRNPGSEKSSGCKKRVPAVQEVDTRLRFMTKICNTISKTLASRKQEMQNPVGCKFG